MAVRICITKFDDLWRFDHDRAYGPFAIAGNLMLQQLQGINYTLIRQSIMGTMIDTKTQSYDGCIGSLQRNESDLLLTFGSLSVPVIGPNLTQTAVDGFDKKGIISAYNKTSSSDSTATHVMDMVLSFTPALWFLLIFIYICLAFLLHASFKVMEYRIRIQNSRIRLNWRFVRTAPGHKDVVIDKQPHKESGWAIIACILKQNSSCYLNEINFRPVGVLYTSLTLLSFLAGLFLTSMIRTDMVVVKDPITVTTYDQLIESGRRPLWALIKTDRSEFELAAKGSKEAKIWEIAVKRGINDSLVQSDMKQFVSHSMQIAGLKEVLLFSRMAATFTCIAACGFSRTKNFMPNVNVLYRHDPGAAEKLIGRVQNHLVNKQISAKRNKRIQWTFEAGTYDVSVDRFASIPSLLFSPEDAAKVFSSIDECTSNVVRKEEQEMSAVTLWHYVSLMGPVCFLFSLAIVFLLKELLTKSRSSVQRLKSAKCKLWFCKLLLICRRRRRVGPHL